MPGSQLVVNHRVALHGSAQHAAIGGSRVLYIANREGAVALKTDDDLRIEREHARMTALGYIAYRPGSIPEPNAGHALFDACGVPERARIQRELRETPSAIITSVVSVRREDAESLGLTTKQDWERLLRSQWARYVEDLGIMEPQDVRWVAAFHVNQRNNLHVHVITWDGSGRLNSLLPRRRMAEANDVLRAHVLRPQREMLNLERTQARDELVSQIRNMELGRETFAQLRASLPAEGSLKHALLARYHPKSAKAVDEAVRRIIASDSELSALLECHEHAALCQARLKGLTGDALEARSRAVKADLGRRLGNALISNVRGRAQCPDAAERPLPAPEGEELLPTPLARRQAESIAEELTCCLSAKERAVLASGIARSVESGVPLAKEAASAARKAPSVKAAASADALASAVVANVAGIGALAGRAVGSEDGGAGEEALRWSVRETGRALAFAVHCARTQSAAPVLKPKQLHARKLKIGG